MNSNIDQDEISKFDAQASKWWDRNGDYRALHDINEIRLNYVNDRVPLQGKDVLDVGCGGGIFSEALAAAGARVTGIDAAENQISVAKQHLLISGHRIHYALSSAEEFVKNRQNRYDVVTCMELLEHVPDPSSLVRASADLVKPGGSLFFSTLNRTFLSYLLAIVAAEYVLSLVPRGTHRYGKFVKPKDLIRWSQNAGLTLYGRNGFQYIPYIRMTRLTRGTRVNYLMHFKKVRKKSDDNLEKPGLV